MTLHSIWLLALTACGGTQSVPPEATAAAPADPSIADAEAYVAEIHARLPSLEQVQAPPTSEGDLTRITVGHRDGDAWLWVTDEFSVGEYGTTVNTYVLRDGHLVAWGRTGHEWSPTDDQDSRFSYFEAQVLYGADQQVVRAQQRSQFLEGSGRSPDLSLVPWAPLQGEPEQPELAQALAALNAAAP